MMQTTELAICCENCGYLSVWVATAMEAAAVAVEHNGGRWDPDSILIPPVGRPSQ